MKNFTLLILIICFISVQQNTFAQSNGVCTPDMSFQDFGIFPGPDTTDVPFSDPTLGISTIGCSGQDFSFVFTAVIPDSLDAEPFIGVPLVVPIESIDVQEVTGYAALGWTIETNLPCSEPDCFFVPDPPEPGGLTFGCAVVTGTLPTVTEQTDYNLAFELEATVTLFNSPTPVALTYPDGDAFPGVYLLRVDPPGSGACLTGVEDIIAEQLSVSQNIPNPYSAETRITLNASKSATYNFIVYNLVGKTIHSETISVNTGENIINFDGSSLNSGIYLYSFGNSDGVITRRMVVEK